MMLSKTVIVFDNLKDTLFLIVHADAADSGAYQKAQQQLDDLEHILATPVSLKAEKHTRRILSPLLDMTTLLPQ